MKFFLFLIFTIFFSIKSFGHGTILIQEVEHEKGFLDVKVYVDKESFLKEEMAIESIRKKPKKGETIIPLSKIHEGKIAIVIYHDEDGNGEPDENYGDVWEGWDINLRDLVIIDREGNYVTRINLTSFNPDPSALGECSGNYETIKDLIKSLY